ncbi:MAG: isocitrate lyase/PEP mutase family protein [bacterium]
MGGKKLREMMALRELVVAPGAFSPLSAKLVQETGFKAVYMSGYCTSAFMYGYPDLGLVTMSEMLANVRLIAEAVEIPLIADGDTGYGNPINVARTVREYERAGAAALHIEDQVWPKRCGHMKGKQVIPAGDMVGKIKAAVDARRCRDLVVIARTDAIAAEGLESAIARCHAYAEAGADVIFADGQENMEQVRRVPEACGEVPCMLNMGPLTPPLSVPEIRRLGYAIVIFPAVCFAPAMLSMQESLQELRDSGRSPALEGESFMRIFGTFNKLLSTDHYLSLDQKYRAG